MSFRRMLIAALVLVVPISSQAQWRQDGVPVSDAGGMQHVSKSIADGAGGVIVVWMDNPGSDADIYAQRINSAGVALWTINGVAVCSAAGFQSFPRIVPDGTGGAIIAWNDYRNDGGDVYAQRINAAGVPQWTANGVAICTALDVQENVVIVTDGVGGAIIAWRDNRVVTFAGDVYAQRVNASGVVQWTANGVGVCVLSSYQASVTIGSDGASGAIVSWNDYRNGNYDVFAQRINASGAPQWVGNGIGICTDPATQSSAIVVATGGGSAFFVWDDYRSGTGSDVLMQKVDGSGSIKLLANGVYVSYTNGDQWTSAAVPDGTGGIYVAFTDARNPSGPDIYAQRVNSSGNPTWLLNGIPVCDVFGGQSWPVMDSDGSNGAILAWADSRSGFPQAYAQRLNASGISLWAPGGVALSVTPAQTRDNFSVVASGVGGAIVSWDINAGGYSDVYAQRAEPEFGGWGRPEPGLTTVIDVLADQGGKVAVNWTHSGHDIQGLNEITHYSVWRAVDGASVSSLLQADGASVDAAFQARALTHERIGTTDYFWEWVGDQNAIHDGLYSLAASTREDSVAGNTATHYFRVVAHTDDPFVYFKSNVVSGHSVDNLAPLAPLSLIAQRAGADVQLKWNRALAPDLRDYSIYRATSTGVTPVPIHFLASAEDTMAVDANAPSSALYYIVTAYDVHANQSAPSNEASVQPMTGIGNTPAITALTVLQNHPNPFSTTTALEIGLPSNADVSVEVFDVAGRRVSAFEVDGAKAGWNRIPFTGRDDRGRPLASGVYFYRVNADGATITKKMVIAR